MMVHEADYIMTDSRGTLWYAADIVENRVSADGNE